MFITFMVWNTGNVGKQFVGRFHWGSLQHSLPRPPAGGEARCSSPKIPHFQASGFGHSGFTASSPFISGTPNFIFLTRKPTGPKGVETDAFLRPANLTTDVMNICIRSLLFVICSTFVKDNVHKNQFDNFVNVRRLVSKLVINIYRSINIYHGSIC